MSVPCIDLEKGIKIALDAMKNSYAPYSNIKVGACVITKNNNFYSGCNVENSSYGLTMCAERSAIFNAVVNGEREPIAIVIASNMEDITPCGSCLQVMSEFSPDGGLMIYICNLKGEIKSCYSLCDLLPVRFILK